MDNEIASSQVEEMEIIKEFPLSGIRRIIASKMEESLRKSPQATVTSKADMSSLMAMKKKYHDQGYEVTFTDLFVKVSEFALKLVPEVNASLQNGKIRQYKSINIGVAIGTDKALFVPVIKNVQDKSLLEVSRELKELILKISDQKITADDFSCGTFTISNMGMFKVDIMTPIINVPEAAILSIGATRKELVVDDDDTIRIKPMTTLSLTLDHAVLDGFPAARFLEAFQHIMENPNDYFS